MDPTLGAAAVGGLSSAFSAYESYEGQKDTNEKNLQIAREQMQFQERMSNSAYQRAVADLKKAGINPMLAYGQGGASTPSGASATMINPKGNLPDLANSAFAAARARAEIENMKQTNRNLQENTKQIRSQVDLNKANTISAITSAKNVAAGTPGKAVESQALVDISNAYNSAKGIARDAGKWIGNKLFDLTAPLYGSDPTKVVFTPKRK